MSKDMQELLTKYRGICRMENIRTITRILFSEAIMMLIVYGLALFTAKTVDWSVSTYFQSASVEILIITVLCVAVAIMLMFLVGIFCLPKELISLLRSRKSADSIESFVQKIDNGMVLVDINDPPQNFVFEKRLDIVPDNQYIGVWSFTPEDETGVLVSIYGDDGPDCTEAYELDIPISMETARQWDDMITPDNARLPYAQVTLFSTWEFMMICPIPTDQVYEAFDMLCRAIVRDIVRRRLAEAVRTNKSIRQDYYTDKALVPYFQKHLPEDADAEVVSAMSRLCDTIQPLLEKQDEEMRKFLAIKETGEQIKIGG